MNGVHPNARRRLPGSDRTNAAVRKRARKRPHSSRMRGPRLNALTQCTNLSHLILSLSKDARDAAAR